jgi:hypothetical protein
MNHATAEQPAAGEKSNPAACEQSYAAGFFSSLHGSYRGANLDEVAVRVIKPDDPLSPAVRHQAIDVFSVRIECLKLFYKAVNFRLFKIQLRM